MGAAEAKAAILANKTALGIEFGSTRIKAVLVDDKNQPIASGGHEWKIVMKTVSGRIALMYLDRHSGLLSGYGKGCEGKI